MTTTPSGLDQPVLDPDLDLLLERTVPVAPELVWAAWTRPEHVVKWFTPAPYTTPTCEIDLRPGGAFRTVMRSPEGEENDNIGCYLEVVENERLVWTNGLLPGFRPLAEPPDLGMTAVISLAPADGGGTHYSALVRHGTPASRQAHADMGFHEGWGAALDQLVALFAEGGPPR